MSFEQADRIVLDEVLGNTSSISTILRQVTAIQHLQATAAGQQAILQQVAAGQKLQASAASQAAVAITLGQVLALLEQVFALLKADRTATSVRFVTIKRRTLDGKEVRMPTMLINDMISNIPLEFDNVAGAAVPPPAGGTTMISVTNDADGTPSAIATAMMGADGKSVDVTPVQPGDTTGMLQDLNFEDKTADGRDLKAMLQFAFTADQAAANVHFVTAGITTRALGT